MTSAFKELVEKCNAAYEAAKGKSPRISLTSPYDQSPERQDHFAGRDAEEELLDSLLTAGEKGIHIDKAVLRFSQKYRNAIENGWYYDKFWEEEK